MAEKTPRGRKKGETAERSGKISLYGLSIEDALRAAAQTGRPPPMEPKNQKRQRKKRAQKTPTRE